MKKILTTLMLLAAMLPVTAQDTMFLPTTPIPNYWPECTWMTDNPVASHLSVVKQDQMNCILEAFGYDCLKDTLRVVGLAGILDTICPTDQYAGNITQANMDIRVPEYLCLLLPGPDSIRWVKKVCYTDVTPRCRVALRTRIRSSFSNVWQFPNLYEVYFDDTVTVQDSFYIGYTCYNNLLFRECLIAGRIPPVETACYIFMSNGYYEKDTVNQLFLEYRDSTWKWFTPRGLYAPFIFPIIDTTGMFADTTVDDTTVVDTTSVSPVADRYTYLMPNPASGETMLYCSFPMQRVEVYDPAGRCVLRRRVDDRMLRLDLSGYPQGAYLVAVVTPAGRTVKRLVVQ